MADIANETAQALEALGNPNKDQRDAAEAWLTEKKKTQLPSLMVALANELCNTARSPVHRAQAGLFLKNCMYSKSEALSEQLAQHWRSMDEGLRNHIKQAVLGTIGTETGASSAAQVIAQIALAEIPYNLWPDLMERLVAKAGEPAEATKVSALETIGYICETVNPKFLEAQSNIVLTAVVSGMGTEHGSVRVQCAATRALLGSLEFCAQNFDDATHRNIIMQKVCEATQSPDKNTKIAALECLVKIMSLYYKYMELYMAEALFPITVNAMGSEEDEVTLQGIEFWSNVCDVETDLDIEREEAYPDPPENVSKYYAQGALQHILPVLLPLLAKQDENDDDDDWNVSKGASVCLALLATCCRDHCCEIVMPFITQHVQNAAWQFRDAAVLAFGSILEGPSPAVLEPIVATALPHFISMMELEPTPQVKDSLAWVLGRTCDLCPRVALSEQFLPKLMSCLAAGLDMEPRVAANCCWAFNALAESAYEQASMQAEGDIVPTYALSQHFGLIVGKLMQTTERPDGGESSLRSAAYEAVMSLMQNFAEDCYDTVAQLGLYVIQKLEAMLGAQAQSREQLSQVTEVQSQLCATLAVLVRNMKPEDVMKVSKQVMEIFVHMFGTQSGSDHNVKEDVFQAMSALIEVIEGQFLPYLESVLPFLLNALSNIEENQVCFIAVGVVGDICRAVGGSILPHCDQIMGLLLQALQNVNLDRHAVPQIVATFGDVALAIGPHFKKYKDVVFAVLAQYAQQAAAIPDEQDFDLIDHINELRENTLEAYTGIIQCFKGDGDVVSADVQLLTPEVPRIIEFIKGCIADPNLSESVVRSSLGLIGDFCDVYGEMYKAQMAEFISADFCHKLLALGRKAKDRKTQVIFTYCKKKLRSIGRASSG